MHHYSDVCHINIDIFYIKTGSIIFKYIYKRDVEYTSTRQPLDPTTQD